MDLIKHFDWGQCTPTLQERKRRAKAGVNAVTVACSGVPSKEDFIKDIIRLTYEERVFVQIRLGYAVVHPEDQYSRTLGLQIAKSDQKTYEFELINCEVNCRKISVRLENKSENIDIIISYPYKAVRPVLEWIEIKGKSPPYSKWLF
ncbi:hypothetical protein UFOVP244_77 [uncultured Caudovirales phage]|uniref:Uncharacterized protein n=1 Tax=uncultured Caudovirales phage TaxID=2100421 RepID=A0A6J7WW65_9CAUD|nr:hypothetical protein UFOVP244_77 [uncultured Caudovirales phage]